MLADDKYVVTIAKYGTRSALRSDVYLNYPVYHQPDGPIEMDYFFWVIRNAQRTIVVDTGFSRHGGDVRGRQTLVDVPQLFARLGVDPAQSPTLIVTHAHFDHIGNLAHFPASRIVLSRQEYDFWMSRHAHRAQFHHSVEDSELALLTDRVAAGQVDFYSGSVTVAPGVEVIEVGGHTPGQSIVIVDTEEGKVLLASDAVHYYEEFEADMPFTSTVDVLGMYEGFDQIRGILASGAAVHLVAGHDPSTLDRFTRSGGELADFVATIGETSGKGHDDATV